MNPSSGDSKMKKKGEFGLPDPMLHGLSGQRESLSSGAGSSHQLEASERAFELTEERAQMEQLRQAQGLHAPLRIQMERRALAKPGHLPCITQRSNLLDDVITGRDETINPRVGTTARARKKNTLFFFYILWAAQFFFFFVLFSEHVSRFRTSMGSRRTTRDSACPTQFWRSTSGCCDLDCMEKKKTKTL